MYSTTPWEVFSEAPVLLGATYGRGGVRMIALGLKDGGVVVWSPGRRTEEAQKSLEHWGEVRYLLAPNRFHNVGLAEWHARYPDAKVVAHPAAHARLKKQVPSVGEIGGLDALERELPEGARVFGPPMARQGETWIAVAKGELRALAVCDAITNLSNVSTAFWLLGFRARLMTNPFFKRVFLKNKKAYKAWLLAELREHPPNLFIPSHGGILRGPDIAANLVMATESA